MPRVTKHPDVRRDELLDVALELCRTVGFASMSVEQITTAAGVAKGTFYYYFSSKSDLLRQLVDRFAGALFEFLSATVPSLPGSGQQRLKAAMDAAAAWKLQQAESSLSFLPSLYSGHNVELRHRLQSGWRDTSRGILAPLIAQGAADGSLRVDDPHATAEIVLSLWIDAADRLWEQALATADEAAFVDVMIRGAAALWTAQERVLGTAPGSFAVEVPLDAVAEIRRHLPSAPQEP